MRMMKFKTWKDPIFHGSEYGDEDEKPPIMITPVGFMSLKLHGELKNDLKFYIAHTNFDIAHEEKSIIENTPGINMLEIFTPYTFKFNVGLCFSVKRVIKDLRKRLCNEQEARFTQEQMLKVYGKKQELEITGTPYLIYILPNGEFEALSFSTKVELKKNLENYYLIQEQIGGEILHGS